MMLEDWSHARHILCVRLDALGDLVMTTPALRAIKYSGKGRRLTLLTSAGADQVAPLLPMIDETIVYEAPWMKASPASASSAADLQMVEALAARRFDAAVIFTVRTQNPLPAALLCYLADIPRRLAHCRENPYHLLTAWVPDTEAEGPPRHEVRRQLDLVAAVGARAPDDRMTIRIPEAARLRVAARLRSAGLANGRPWAVIHAGASAPSRRYPPESFAAVAQMLADDFGFGIVWTGTAAERELIDGIRAGLAAPGLSLAGSTTLEELAALLAAAPLLISNNTGPVHLAAAVGTPVVDLYALTNMQHAPWRVAHELLFHDVPCKNCLKSVCPEGHHDCLRRVTPEAVVEAAYRLLGRRIRDQKSEVRGQRVRS